MSTDLIVLLMVLIVLSALMLLMRMRPAALRSFQFELGKMLRVRGATHAPAADGGGGLAVLDAAPAVARTKPPEAVAEFVTAVEEHLVNAHAIGNTVFWGEAEHECNVFRERTACWARGEYRAPSGRYNAVLVQLYRAATVNVFCTSIQEYLSTWDDELGRTILKAHAQSKAEVTRLFVFSRRAEITERAVEIMRMHRDTGKVNVRIFIDSESPFNFPPDLSRDFTIIDDGKVIGITTAYGPAQLEATWFFRNEEKRRVILPVRQSLCDSSFPLSQL